MLPRMWATPPCRNIDVSADSHGRLWYGFGRHSARTSSGTGSCRLVISSLGTAAYLSRNVRCSQPTWLLSWPPTEEIGEARKTTRLTAISKYVTRGARRVGWLSYSGSATPSPNG